MSHPAKPPSRTLSTREIGFYALPRFGSAMMFMMVAVYLPLFYTDTLLLAPAFVGWTFLIGRVWDGLTDPIMGHLSDKTKLGMGRRRPYFLISAVPVGIAFYLLWSPPEALEGWGLFLYLTATYLFAFTCWTMFSIPHTALGAELTMDYHERTVLAGAREALGMVGLLAGAIAPVAFVQAFGGERTGYSYLSIFTGVITGLFILLCFFNTKENPEFQRRRTGTLKEGLKVLVENRPFGLLVAAFLLAFVGEAMIPLMTPYMAFYVIEEGWVIPCIVGVYALGAAFSIPFWTRLSRRKGKKETLSYGFLLVVAVFAGGSYISEGDWLHWIFYATLAGVGVGDFMAIAPSMIADTIDLDELETGMRREGAYFGIWSVVQKAGVGITAFAALQTLDLMGYVPKEEQTYPVYWAIKGLFCFGTAGFFACAYLILRKYPVTREEHDRVRAELDARNDSSNEAA